MVLPVSDYSGTGHMSGKIIGITRESIAKGHLLAGHWRFFGEWDDLEVVGVRTAFLQIEDQ